MKKNIMMTLLCLLAIETRAADYAYLVFTTADGNQQAVTATDLTITFSDGTLIATDGSQTLALFPPAEGPVPLAEYVPQMGEGEIAGQPCLFLELPEKFER